MAGGRHRPPRSRVKAAGVAALLVVTLGGGGYAGARWGYPAVTGGQCGASALALHVSAAPDIAPALTTAAKQWNATKPHAGGHCIRADVTAVNSGDVLQALTANAQSNADASAAPTSNPLVPTDVWVPDSSAWIEQVKAVDSTTFSDVSKPFMSSPVVVAVPQAAASAVGLTKSAISQKTFISLVRTMRNSDLTASETSPPSKFQLGMADPATDAAALAGATLITGLDHQAQNGLPENAALIADFRFISPVGQQSATAKDLLGSFVTKVDNVPPMTAAFVSEQAAIAHNVADGSNPLKPVYIDGFKMSLDYPIATLANRSSAISDAAGLFAAAVASPEYRANFAGAGFRGPDGTQGPGFPTGNGIATSAVATEAMGYNNQTQPSLRLWAGANEEARVLTMVNVSSSMATSTSYNGATRLQLAAAAAQHGLQLFTPGSSVGVWGFAPGVGKSDYKEIVPIDQLGKNLPTVLGAFGAAKPSSASGCGLYPALASAYGKMRDEYSPGELNTIVIFTDCAGAPPGNTMNKSALTATLSNMVDPANSIGVIIINVGDASNQPELQGIVDTVNGAAVNLTDPSQIVQIFMRSLVVLS